MDIARFVWLKTLNAPAFQAEWRRLSPADREAFQRYSRELRQQSLEKQSRREWGRGTGIERVFKEAKAFLEDKYRPEFHVWVQAGAYFEIRHEQATWAVRNGLFQAAESRANADMHCIRCVLPVLRRKIPKYNSLGVHIGIVQQDGGGDVPPRFLDYANHVYLSGG